MKGLLLLLVPIGLTRYLWFKFSFTVILESTLVSTVNACDLFGETGSMIRIFAFGKISSEITSLTSIIGNSACVDFISDEWTKRRPLTLILPYSEKDSVSGLAILGSLHGFELTRLKAMFSVWRLANRPSSSPKWMCPVWSNSSSSYSISYGFCPYTYIFPSIVSFLIKVPSLIVWSWVSEHVFPTGTFRILVVPSK